MYPGLIIVWFVCRPIAISSGVFWEPFNQPVVSLTRGLGRQAVCEAIMFVAQLGRLRPVVFETSCASHLPCTTALAAHSACLGGFVYEMLAS